MSFHQKYVIKSIGTTHQPKVYHNVKKDVMMSKSTIITSINMESISWYQKLHYDINK